MRFKMILVLTLSVVLISLSVCEETGEYVTQDAEIVDKLVEHSEPDPKNDVDIVESQSAQTEVADKHKGPQPRSGTYYFEELDLGFDYSGYNWDDPNNRMTPSKPLFFDTDGPAYTITPQRLQQIRKNFMYWYFDQDESGGRGDYQENIHTSMPQAHKNFNFQLPFFGFRFNYTRISMNGYLEFSDPPEHYTYPLVFPIKDWPKTNDPSFIGIFFSKCRTGKLYGTDIDQRAPGVYFRMERDLQSRTDRFGVEVRERVMWDIRDGGVGADTFIPKHVIIVTWKNMTFAGGIDNSLYKTNTFQLVLTTDEEYTYAIFNYATINWLAHTEAGGDTTSGEGGVPAFIGFNAGNGTQAYEYKPYSQASVLRDLTRRGCANGFPGRHIFRIDEKIMLGTCNKDIETLPTKCLFVHANWNTPFWTKVDLCQTGNVTRIQIRMFASLWCCSLCAKWAAKIHYAGRREGATVATGNGNVHRKEVEEILAKPFEL